MASNHNRQSSRLSHRSKPTSSSSRGRYRSSRFHNGKEDSQFRKTSNNNGGRGEITKDMLRYEMVILRNEGLTMEEIGVRVGCNKSTVCRTLRRFDETGSLYDRPRNGCKKLTTSKEDRALIKMAENDRCLTSGQLKRKVEDEWGKQLSARTIRRRLLQGGLAGRRHRRKPKQTTASVLRHG